VPAENGEKRLRSPTPEHEGHIHHGGCNGLESRLESPSSAPHTGPEPTTTGGSPPRSTEESPHHPEESPRQPEHTTSAPACAPHDIEHEAHKGPEPRRHENDDDDDEHTHAQSPHLHDTNETDVPDHGPALPHARTDDCGPSSSKRHHSETHDEGPEPYQARRQETDLYGSPQSLPRTPQQEECGKDSTESGIRNQESPDLHARVAALSRTPSPVSSDGPPSDDEASRTSRNEPFTGTPASAHHDIEHEAHKGPEPRRHGNDDDDDDEHTLAQSPMPDAHTDVSDHGSMVAHARTDDSGPSSSELHHSETHDWGPEHHHAEERVGDSNKRAVLMTPHPYCEEHEHRQQGEKEYDEESQKNQTRSRSQQHDDDDDDERSRSQHTTPRSTLPNSRGRDSVSPESLQHNLPLPLYLHSGSPSCSHDEVEYPPRDDVGHNGSRVKSSSPRSTRSSRSRSRSPAFGERRSKRRSRCRSHQQGNEESVIKEDAMPSLSARRNDEDAPHIPPRNEEELDNARLEDCKDESMPHSFGLAVKLEPRESAPWSHPRSHRSRSPRLEGKATTSMRSPRSRSRSASSGAGSFSSSDSDAGDTCRRGRRKLEGEHDMTEYRGECDGMSGKGPKATEKIHVGRREAGNLMGKARNRISLYSKAKIRVFKDTIKIYGTDARRERCKKYIDVLSKAQHENDLLSLEELEIEDIPKTIVRLPDNHMQAIRFMGLVREIEDKWNVLMFRAKRQQAAKSNQEEKEDHQDVEMKDKDEGASSMEVEKEGNESKREEKEENKNKSDGEKKELSEEEAEELLKKEWKDALAREMEEEQCAKSGMMEEGKDDTHATDEHKNEDGEKTTETAQDTAQKTERSTGVTGVLGEDKEGSDVEKEEGKGGDRNLNEDDPKLEDNNDDKSEERVREKEKSDRGKSEERASVNGEDHASHASGKDHSDKGSEKGTSEEAIMNDETEAIMNEEKGDDEGKVKEDGQTSAKQEIVKSQLLDDSKMAEFYAEKEEHFQGPASQEDLIIFGSRWGRRGAELHILSSLESSYPGHIETILTEVLERDEDKQSDDIPEDQSWGSIHMILEASDISYALGKNGQTRRKVEMASECIVQYIGPVVICSGTKKNRCLARNLLTWLFDQLDQRPIDIEKPELRDDCMVLKIPQNCIGLVCGAKRAALSDLELQHKVLTFFLGAPKCAVKDEEGAREDQKANNERELETLLIFGPLRQRLACSLRIKMMVEKKEPGYFSNHIKPMLQPDEGPAVDVVELADSNVAYVVGKNGSTKRKITNAAGCAIELFGELALFAGTLKERIRGREYTNWLLMQKDGKIKLRKAIIKDRRDCLPVFLSDTSHGAIHARGECIRHVEKYSSCFIYVATLCNDDGEVDGHALLIFSHLKEYRQSAARLLGRELLPEIPEFGAFVRGGKHKDHRGAVIGAMPSKPVGSSDERGDRKPEEKASVYASFNIQDHGYDNRGHQSSFSKRSNNQRREHGQGGIKGQKASSITPKYQDRQPRSLPHSAIAAPRTLGSSNVSSDRGSRAVQQQNGKRLRPSSAQEHRNSGFQLTNIDHRTNTRNGREGQRKSSDREAYHHGTRSSNRGSALEPHAAAPSSARGHTYARAHGHSVNTPVTRRDSLLHNHNHRDRSASRGRHQRASQSSIIALTSSTSRTSGYGSGYGTAGGSTNSRRYRAGVLGEGTNSVYGSTGGTEVGSCSRGAHNNGRNDGYNGANDGHNNNSAGRKTGNGDGYNNNGGHNYGAPRHNAGSLSQPMNGKTWSRDNPAGRHTKGNGGGACRGASYEGTPSFRDGRNLDDNKSGYGTSIGARESREQGCGYDASNGSGGMYGNNTNRCRYDNRSGAAGMGNASSNNSNNSTKSRGNAHGGKYEQWNGSSSSMKTKKEGRGHVPFTSQVPSGRHSSDGGRGGHPSPPRSGSGVEPRYTHSTFPPLDTHTGSSNLNNPPPTRSPSVSGRGGVQHHRNDSRARCASSAVVNAQKTEKDREREGGGLGSIHGDKFSRHDMGGMTSGVGTQRAGNTPRSRCGAHHGVASGSRCGGGSRSARSSQGECISAALDADPGSSRGHMAKEYPMSTRGQKRDRSLSSRTKRGNPSSTRANAHGVMSASKVPRHHIMASSSSHQESIPSSSATVRVSGASTFPTSSRSDKHSSVHNNRSGVLVESTTQHGGISTPTSQRREENNSRDKKSRESVAAAKNHTTSDARNGRGTTSSSISGGKNHQSRASSSSSSNKRKVETRTTHASNKSGKKNSTSSHRQKSSSNSQHAAQAHKGHGNRDKGSTGGKAAQTDTTRCNSNPHKKKTAVVAPSSAATRAHSSGRGGREGSKERKKTERVRKEPKSERERSRSRQRKSRGKKSPSREKTSDRRAHDRKKR